MDTVVISSGENKETASLCALAWRAQYKPHVVQHQLKN